MNLHILGEDPSHSPKGRCIDCSEFIEDEYNPKDCYCKAKPNYVTQNALRNLACKDFKPKQPQKINIRTEAKSNNKDFDIFMSKSIDNASAELNTEKAKSNINKAIEQLSRKELLQQIQIYKDTFQEITECIHLNNQTSNSLMETLNEYNKNLVKLMSLLTKYTSENRELKSQLARLMKLRQNEQLKSKLFDNLRHYWYSSGFFTNKQFDQALCKLLSNYNPFLRPETQEHLKLKDYPFDEFIFEERLLNDYCYVCKDPLDFSQVSVCWKCHNYICHTCKPPTKERKYYACAICLAEIEKEAKENSK